ncbi:hypothetical protein AAG906_004056 [Vitis piasezkii]
MLHQSNASQDAKKDDLRHEKDVINDEVEKNGIPMDVNIGMELKDDYSNDDSVIDIAKLFGTPTILGEFSDMSYLTIYLLPFLSEDHPFTNPTKRKKLRKEIEEPLTLFDPLSTIDIDYMHIDKKWFQSPSNHGSWLVDTFHIDVAFFFSERRIENPHMFSQKLTTMDIMFWNDILSDYANGSQPLYYVKWPDVDIVHVPMNGRASHWVLGVVHLPYYRFYGDTKVNYYEWEIERSQDIPQQNMRNGDCDIFINKYVEYLMHNHPLKSLTSARMD